MKLKTNYLFLLGGPDLEMLEIRKILEDKGLDFLDASLGWSNADWQAYQKKKYKSQIIDAIDAGKKIIGIELFGDIPNEEHYYLIDHHNERQHLPSSIEQLAELLHIELTRWQLLVGINDRGFIGALKEFGASEKEIEEIRKADRAAQNVTEEDEALAVESIKKSRSQYDHVTVVKSLTAKFSPIADRLWKNESLLIYTDQELTYYGRYKSIVAYYFQSEGIQATLYDGGGEKGFFGISLGTDSGGGIHYYKDKIIQIVNQEYLKVSGHKQIKSYHVFMFPFKWQHAECAVSKEPPPLKEQFDLAKFESKLIGIDNVDQPDKNKKWRRKKLKLSSDTYNEYNYFHPHVREILYDLDEDLQTKESENNGQLIRHFQYKLDSSNRPYYCVKIARRERPYRLQIDSVILNLYSTGTGVLSFHLRNFDCSDSDDILKINQFGRRLFPPFFNLDEQWINTGIENQFEGGALLDTTQRNELAEAIWIEEKREDQTYQLDNSLEDFSAYRSKSHIVNGPFQLPKFITTLFPTNFFGTHQKQLEAKQNSIYLRPVIDDRMFVVSWYGNNETINKLKSFSSDRLDKGLQRGKWNGRALYQHALKADSHNYGYRFSEWWYKYILVDADNLTIQNRLLLPDYNEKHTYSRWVDWGTLFGISRYSCVMLTTELGSESNRYNGVPAFLIGHLQTMYYKMAELCLVQRATLLNFSDEVTHVSDMIGKDGEEEKKEAMSKIKDLYKHYILFVNKIYFREVTAQEQGIEMYNMFQQSMRLKDDIKDLDQEIEELMNYSRLQYDESREEQEKENNTLLTKISILGALFLPVGIILGVFNMSSLPENLELTRYPYAPFWWRIFLTGVFSLVSLIVMNWWLKFWKWKSLLPKKNNRK